MTLPTFDTIEEAHRDYADKLIFDDNDASKEVTSVEAARATAHALTALAFEMRNIREFIEDLVKIAKKRQ